MMKSRIAAGLIAVAAAGGAMLLTPTAASASVDSGYDCGLSYPWGSGLWNNCVDNDQLIVSTLFDPVTERVFSWTQCVEAQQAEYLSPGFFVLDASVAASSC